MFLNNCWYAAGWDYELIDGRMLSRTILEKKILFYRGDSGKVIALEDRCCHRGAPLSIGRREGDDVRCMYHGLLFDPSGKCIQIPGQEKIPPTLTVRSFPAHGKYGLFWVWMGDPAKADPDNIIDLPYMDNPMWKGIPDYLHYDANYLLIIDNLSDFAHLAFVHTNTLGGSEEYAFVTKPVSVERLDDGFRVERWHMNGDAPPFHRKVIPNKNDKVDRRNIGHMRIPGVFSLESMFAPAGNGAEKGNLEGAREYRNCQFITPETRKTTHFFHIYLNNFEGDDHNISRSLRDSLMEGFMEDKHIIEYQQEMLDADPDFELKQIAADVPLSHFRQTLSKMIEDERNGQTSPSVQATPRIHDPVPGGARKPSREAVF
ncbi:MAG TPA: aromatic ring-hydroxylating dioxygenase subunit alpha [Woeseiaceae bacterium]|nr:aromatic ring-hydroxylating dioxygenase subunit alpha [Woeseiaceae bacterium]